MKIIAYGVLADENLGGPSLLHGFAACLRETCPGAELVCYQKTAASAQMQAEMGFPIRVLPAYGPAKLLTRGLLRKMRILRGDAFLDELAGADAVANVEGICFCDNLNRRRENYLAALKTTCAHFAISLLARLYGARSIKTTASYGPMQKRQCQIQARWAARLAFGAMFAREEESRRQMREVAGVRVTLPVTPDLANLWTVPAERRPVITVSPSHQIIRQWTGAASYVDCMAALIRHMLESTDCEIVLLPNEMFRATRGNDAQAIAMILAKLPADARLIDAGELSAGACKRRIAESELSVSSRYHGCVAALSSGVPTLVVGWHYKYEELMALYGQSAYILPSESCTEEALTGAFDALWRAREESRAAIVQYYPVVRAKILDAYRPLWGK